MVKGILELVFAFPERLLSSLSLGNIPGNRQDLVFIIFTTHGDKKFFIYSRGAFVPHPVYSKYWVFGA